MMWCPKPSSLLKCCFSECLKKSSYQAVSGHGTSVSELMLPSHEKKMMTSPQQKQVVVKKEDSAEHGFKKIRVFPSPAMIETQSVLLPGRERIRASGATDQPEVFIEFPDTETRIVCDTVRCGMFKSTSGKCLGRRSPSTGKYEWITYTEVENRMLYIGSGLVDLGIPMSRKAMVGICTKTRPEFVLTMLACSHFSMVLVPLYECFGSDILTHIIAEVEMEIVFCETSKLAADIIAQADKYPNLKHLILIEMDSDVDLSHPVINILSLASLEERGKNNMKIPQKPQPDDLFCICYTSGTTGVPKGVMISHRNILSCVAALNHVLTGTIRPSSSLMSYLPCAHIYEIINEVFCLHQGGEMGFYSGSTETLLSDIVELKPTVLPLVPKLMNLIYSGVKKKIGPNLFRRQLLHLSLQQKEKELKKGIVDKTAFWDRLMLSKIQKVLGGHCQLLISASAPVSKEVMRFFRCSMGCLVFEVYGLSEVGAATMTLLCEHDSGFVGPPLPNNHIKLVSVPELSYNSEDDMGEICIRGSNVFCGYFKNPEATRESVDQDGWYHTGDIGKWLPNGALAIIDRMKHIFKLSQGEYIMPEKTENIYVQSHIVSQVYVDGDSDKDFIVGIIVPDQNAFEKWARENGFVDDDYESLCRNENVRKAVLAHLLKMGKRKNLNSLHQVGNIYLITEPFSLDNGLLTPTMKLKRSIARKHFSNTFHMLYEEGNWKKIHNL